MEPVAVCRPPRQIPRFSEDSRKQSASDLQSRLKTRKLLGVGELARDNGDIYKSKISQLLGINESLYVRLPRGLMYWNTVNTLYFYFIGTMCLLFPSLGMYFDLGRSYESSEALEAGRLYGAVLISYGLLFRSILLQRETRTEIATLLLVTASMHLLQLSVIFLSESKNYYLIAIRLATVAGNLIYHAYVDSQGGVYRQLSRFIDDLCVASTPVVDRPPIKTSDATTNEEKSKNE